MKQIKFAVVGFGHIGKRHAKIISGHPEALLTAVIDNGETREKEFREAGYKCPFFKDISEFLKEDKNQSDVVIVAAPNGLHAPLAIDALKKKYHVVIEKPMALHKSDCEEIIFQSLKSSRNVFVVKQNRYSPPSKWLKSLVDDGILGEVFMVHINCLWNRDDRYYGGSDWKGSLKLDGGPLFTQFSHFIDIMYWIFGDIKNISSKFFNHNHRDTTEFEDTGVVNFEFCKQGFGSINFTTSCWDTNFESSITIIGSNGSVKVGGQYMNEIEYCNIKDYEVPELEMTNPPNDYGPYKGSAANHHYVIQNVIDTLSGKGSIDTNAMEGLKVVEIIERIYSTRKIKNLIKNNKYALEQ